MLICPSESRQQCLNLASPFLLRIAFELGHIELWKHGWILRVCFLIIDGRRIRSS